MVSEKKLCFDLLMGPQYEHCHIRVNRSSENNDFEKLSRLATLLSSLIARWWVGLQTL